MKSSNNNENLIRIGKIVAAHGIRGVVKVYSYAESTQCYTEQDGLLLIDPSGHEHHRAVDWIKPHKKNSFRLAFKGVSTRTQAEALVGCVIWVSKESLPPLEETDTNYWFDLIGMAVYETDDVYLGRITAIIETGANDVYVVETPEGHPAKEILLPAISSVILEVDVGSQRMVVELPEGLV